jgi:ribosomal protein S18 acetylase RimI-like enzyme
MIRIDTAAPEDVDALVPLFEAYRRFYRCPPDSGAARRYLEERMRQQDAVIYAAREEENTLCGFVQLYPLWSSTRLQRLWLLNDLFVDPGCRGRGIGKRLIERSKLLARETGACGLQLETAKDNLVSNALYRREGFEILEGNFYFWQDR